MDSFVDLYRFLLSITESLQIHSGETTHYLAFAELEVILVRFVLLRGKSSCTSAVACSLPHLLCLQLLEAISNGTLIVVLQILHFLLGPHLQLLDNVFKMCMVTDNFLEELPRVNAVIIGSVI